MTTKTMLIGFLLAAVAIPAAAQDENPRPGKIIAYRGPGVFGIAAGCPIRIEGQQVGDLDRSEYLELELPAGRHVLTNKSSSVEVTVSSGETRYVRCKIKLGFVSGGAELQISDEASFIEQRDQLSLAD